MQRFFNTCNPEEYVLFQFFLHTGFRDQEVRHAFFDDVDLEAGIVRVTPKPHYKFSPKGKQGREVPIPDAAANHQMSFSKTAKRWPNAPS
jgi:integrase/recombinase XerD